MTQIISVKEVKGKKDLKTFIYLPAKINRNNKLWVHPIYMDEWEYFNPKKNKSFDYSDTVLFLCYLNNEAVGRTIGIINNKYNELQNEKCARFGFFESIDNQDVAHALVEAVANWASEKGMTDLIGPFGFSDKDPQGLLVEGFEYSPVVATVYNYPYVKTLLENEGFIKKLDLVAYNIPVPKEIPESHQRVFERISRNKEFELIEPKTKKEIRPHIRPVFKLINETFINIYGFQPVSDEWADDFAKRYMPILNPNFIKAIKKDGELVAFIVAMPDLNQGIKKAKGKILPFGILKILREAKRTKQLVLLLGAIKEPYRGMGLDTIMAMQMIASANKAKLVQIDSHLEMETNTKVRREMEKMGGKVYKVFRVFQKNLK